MMSKFKHLSGDFVAEYNNALRGLLGDQKELDRKYEDIVKKLVEREKQRLESITPMPFDIGEKVQDSQGNTGVVVSCPVNLSIFEEEDFHGKQYGPGKYYRIEDVNDEEVITCEGMVRVVQVELLPNDLEADWMIGNKIVTYWPDELTVIAD